MLQFFCHLPRGVLCLSSKKKHHLNVAVNTWKWRKYDDESGISWGALRGACVAAVMMLSVTAAWGRSHVWTSPAAKRQPEALSRDPPASHVHFATKPLKGIPWVLLSVHWPPALWSADPMCFCGTEVIILWPCHVIVLIQMFVWSCTGNA